MLLSDEEVAAVVSYIRQAWGNQASGVSALDVTRHRATGTR
jgi:mono/diheme cytochrome c family protein